MPRSKLPDHLISIALLVCAVLGCKQIESLARPTVLKSADGKFQLTVPAGWREDLSLNERAGISGANPLQELYAIVIIDEKSDFTDEMTLEQFTDITLDSMKANVASADSTPPLPMKINGNSARQYVLQGAVKNVKVTYFITTVETSAHFHQIITWTLTSRISKNQTTLQSVTETFRPATQSASDGSAPTK
jgi:hypothetical protein